MSRKDIIYRLEYTIVDKSSDGSLIRGLKLFTSFEGAKSYVEEHEPADILGSRIVKVTLRKDSCVVWESKA